MIAARGSLLDGSLIIANTISLHLMVRVVLQMDVNMFDRSLAKLFVDGIVHCVPFNNLGITKVATPLLFSACEAGHLVVLTAALMEYNALLSMWLVALRLVVLIKSPTFFSILKYLGNIGSWMVPKLYCRIFFFP